MEDVRCILIDPPINVDIQNNEVSELHEFYPPIGLAYIAAVLRENGVDVNIIDARSTGTSHEELTKIVCRENPDVVGVTVVTSQLKSVLKVCKRIKEELPNTKIVLGGPHVHFEHKEVIRNDFVDFCVRGEGELTMLELVNALSNGGDLGEVEGITFKKGDDIIVNLDRSFIQDLDSLPFPARDLLPNDEYRKAGGKNFTSILATRGCPFGCHYCSASAMWGTQRRRSVENVLDEIEHVYETYEVKHLRFIDDIFVLDTRWVIELCRGMVKQGLAKIGWVCDGRVNLMSEELLREMKRANCQIIFYGIEFGSQRILDFCRKGFTIDDVYKTIGMTQKAGIASYGYFMIGYSTETREMIEQTIKLARDLDLDYAGFSIATPFPGTKLYEYCKENNLLRTTDWTEYDMSRPGRSVIKLEGMGEEGIIELYHKAHYEFQFRRQLQQFKI